MGLTEEQAEAFISTVGSLYTYLQDDNVVIAKRINEHIVNVDNINYYDDCIASDYK